MRLIFILLTISTFSFGQNRVFYAGNSGPETFYDVAQLSDGTLLIAGTADDLDWIPSGVAITTLSTRNIKNNQGNNRFAFLLQLDSALNNILNIVTLPQDEAENIQYIKFNHAPRTKTDKIYLSGTTEDSNDGGYFIGLLNNNFVDGLPTAFTWTNNENVLPEIILKITNHGMLMETERYIM